MAKKEYLQPAVEVFDLRMQPVLGNFSVKGEGLHTGSDPDMDDEEDNRARHNYYGWDDF